jgi:hypothetical protein
LINSLFFSMIREKKGYWGKRGPRN